MENLKKIVREIQAPEREKKIKELENVEGFYYVKHKEEEIEEELRSIVDTDDVENKISQEFKKVFG